MVPNNEKGKDKIVQQQEITRKEIRKAIKKQNVGKTPGGIYLRAEMLNYGEEIQGWGDTVNENILITSVSVDSEIRKGAW